LLTGKKINERASNDSTAGRATLAAILELIGEKVVDNTGAIIPDSPLKSRVATESTTNTTATNADDAKRQAAGAYQKTQMASVIVKIHMVGDPLLTAKSIVMLQGIGDMYAGRYYVTTARHALGTNGYTTDLECRRDGTNGSGGAGAAVAPGRPSPQTLAEFESKKQALIVEVISFRNNLDANPALINDPVILAAGRALDARAQALSAQAASFGSPASAGVQNAKPVVAHGELAPREVLDPRTGGTRTEYK
jgi:hypothetical protein